jgi:hypothetical protein
LIWGALSDERTGLSFAVATGLRQRSHFLVRVSYDSWPYFTVSDSRLPFSSPPTTRRVTVDVFDPASTRVFYCLGILRAYIDAERTHFRKHMSRDRYPASPLAPWLDLQQTSCDLYPLLCDITADAKKTLLQYYWPRVCCWRCLAMDLHVIIYLNVVFYISFSSLLNAPSFLRVFIFKFV